MAASGIGTIRAQLATAEVARHRTDMLPDQIVHVGTTGGRSHRDREDRLGVGGGGVLDAPIRTPSRRTSVVADRLEQVDRNDRLAHVAKLDARGNVVLQSLEPTTYREQDVTVGDEGRGVLGLRTCDVDRRLVLRVVMHIEHELRARVSESVQVQRLPGFDHRLVNPHVACAITELDLGAFEVLPDEARLGHDQPLDGCLVGTTPETPLGELLVLDGRVARCPEPDHIVSTQESLGRIELPRKEDLAVDEELAIDTLTLRDVGVLAFDTGLVQQVGSTQRSHEHTFTRTLNLAFFGKFSGHRFLLFR